MVGRTVVDVVVHCCLLLGAQVSTFVFHLEIVVLIGAFAEEVALKLELIRIAHESPEHAVLVFVFITVRLFSVAKHLFIHYSIQRFSGRSLFTTDISLVRDLLILQWVELAFPFITPMAVLLRLASLCFAILFPALCRERPDRSSHSSLLPVEAAVHPVVVVVR